MGKASKWMRNFLMGKKEDKKKINTAFSLEYQSTKMESQPGTPKVRKKWSFRKLSGKGASYKLSKSFDSIDASKLPVQAPAESMARQNHIEALVAIRGHVENAAATKIQAAFRSYLARRALHALKGLVKLQALVRGHIVRKQTASTLKRMHALMSIQVRARVHRIQMAEEAQIVVRSQSSMENGFPHDNRKRASINPNETRQISKSTSDHLNHAQIERINTTLNSEPLSISKRHQYEEYCFSTAENSPRSYMTIKADPRTASFTRQEPNYQDPMSYGYRFSPNYMTNTESSRAKVRSQSEPKRRPKWSMKHKNKQTEIADGMHFSLDDPVMKRSSSQCKYDSGSENHDPWFVRLYKTKSSFRNSKYDSDSTPISHSHFHESLSAYEPNFSLF
ncbi:protein IQ-DOMAIN 14 [Morus notabilis]|uniref:protein IQ-DOMAIN 14 n=1 Tax=Morus notabilis TaxID=981085 RepID=UPI000CED0B86|nr:protein IQ-DOMAIN 14 [Morus notabilis]